MNLDEFVEKMKKFEEEYGVPVDFELTNDYPKDRIFLAPLSVIVVFES